MDHDARSGLRAAITAFTLWGLFTVYWKQLTEFPPLELIGWRVVTATGYLLAIVVLTGRWDGVRHAFTQPRLVGRLAGAAVLLAVNWLTYVWAVVNDHVIETALGYFLAPLTTMVFGVVVLHEPLRPLQRWAMGFGAAAAVVLTLAYGRVPWIAVLIALSWSGYALLKKNVPLGPLQSLSSELLILFVPALVIIGIGSFSSEGVAQTATGAQFAMVLGTGVITALPLTLFAYAAKRVPLTVLGPAQYLVPIINLLLGWLVYGEPMNAAKFVGFALVWIALLMVSTDMVLASRSVRRPLAPAP